MSCASSAVTLSGAGYLALLQSARKPVPNSAAADDMLTGIALFLALARSSELVVVRASGRSGLRFLLAPVAVAFVVGLFAVAVLDPLVAAASKNLLTACGGDAQPGPSGDVGLGRRVVAASGRSQCRR